MNRKYLIKLTLLLGYVFLAFGGWLLHLRFHSPLVDGENFIPAISGFLSVVILPLMFYFKPTLQYAYVINGFTVILGTILMGQFSIAHFSVPLTIYTILFNTLLADIAILWGKFAVGKTIFDLELLNTSQDTVPRGRYFRYPNTDWWLVHLFAWAAVYAAGNLIMNILL